MRTPIARILLALCALVGVAWSFSMLAVARDLDKGLITLLGIK